MKEMKTKENKLRWDTMEYKKKLKYFFFVNCLWVYKKDKKAYNLIISHFYRLFAFLLDEGKNVFNSS